MLESCLLSLVFHHLNAYDVKLAILNSQDIKSTHLSPTPTVFLAKYVMSTHTITVLVVRVLGVDQVRVLESTKNDSSDSTMSRHKATGLY